MVELISKYITIYVTLTTVAQLSELAQKWGKSKSEIVRDLIEKAWNEEQEAQS